MKPMVLIESFELNQTVAKTCGTPDNPDVPVAPNPSNHYNAASCGFQIDDNTWIFATGVSKCNDDQKESIDPVEQGDPIMCYNGPAGGITVFSS